MTTNSSSQNSAAYYPKPYTSISPGPPPPLRPARPPQPESQHQYHQHLTQQQNHHSTCTACGGTGYLSPLSTSSHTLPPILSSSPSLTSSPSISSPSLTSSPTTNPSSPYTTTSSPRTTTARFPCLYPDCKTKAVFRRSTDLKRHINTQHLLDQKLDCVFKWCGRVGEGGFTRRDHLREHLREVHHMRIEKVGGGRRGGNNGGVSERGMGEGGVGGGDGK